jgi:hypothetical protein
MLSSSRSFLARVFLLFLFAILSFAPATAQYMSGFEATVIDPSGAAIAGAQVTITNGDTQVQQSAVSDGQGYVHIRNLPLGRYRAEVKAPGFETWVQSDIKLEGDQVRTLYPKLAIGEQVTNVIVTAESESVDTTRGNVGRTLETRTVQDSPLIGENLYASVATLAPGVTGLGDASGSISAAGSIGVTPFASEAGFQINAAGQRQEMNEFQVDGTTVNGNSRDGVVNITPEPDTVAEMKVTASSFSADKGVQSGALIEIFTKAGTNKFHGSLSEMHFDNVLSARTEFQSTIPKTIRNDFGGTFGGPIFKDKTFFFGSLFWMKSILGGTSGVMMETQDFENYVTTNFPNSMATRFFQAAPPSMFGPAVYDPNGVSSLTVSQIEAAYGSPYTPPNIPGSLVAEAYEYVPTDATNNGFQGHLRIDHNLRGDTDKLFYSMFRNTTHAENANVRPTYSYINPNSTLYNKVDYLHTFSPTLLNELGIAYNRLTGSQPAKVPLLPNVGIAAVDDAFWQWGPSGWIQNNFLVHDSVTWMHGPHSFHFGLDVHRLQDMDNFTNGEDRPFFWFNNILDFAADQPSYQSGPVLDVQTDGVAHNLYQRVLMLYVAPYVQDDWKVNRRLTLNLGVRMDYYGHLSTVMNSQQPIAFFTPGSGSTWGEQVLNGGMKVRGSNGIATDSAQYRFAPRIGFAWDVFGNGNTALRGGYAEFSDKVGEYAYVNNMRTNPPNYALPTISIYTPGVTLANFSYGISSTTDNGGAQGFAPPPGVSYQVNPNGSLVGTQIGVGGIDPNLKPPLVHSWALGIEQKISGFMVEATYMGTASRDLYIQTDVNRFVGDMIQNLGLQTRLNPDFGAITYGRSTGVANSNLAAFSISKHFTKGWTAHAIYTYGKSLDYTSSNDNDNGNGGAENIFDAAHVSAQYGRANFDSRQRFSGDLVWDVPGFGNGIAHAITAGWSLAPIIILQSGQPFTVYTSAPFGPVWNNPSCATAITAGCQVVGNSGGDYNADGNDYDVPDVPSFGNHISTSRSDFLKGLFPTSAFPAPAFGQEGHLGRNTYDGPGYAVVNLSVQRTFKISKLGEGGLFEMRGEIFNLFNRVNLTTPNSDLNGSQFGVSTGQSTPRQIQVVAHIRF